MKNQGVKNMSRQALEMALEFIERVNKDGWILADFEPEMYNTINAIKEALAQPEQEPLARSDAYDMIDRFLHNNLNSDADYAEYSKALDSIYTTPPQRTWVGLTDEDWDETFGNALTIGEAIKVTEAKLKEKNT
jgi:hypothetical protein